MPTVNDHPFLWFVLCGLATWRISSIITRETIFRWFRLLMGNSMLGIAETEGTTPLAEWVNCIYCMSVWVGFFTAVVFDQNPLIQGILQCIVMGFAISGLALMFERFSSRGE